MGGYWIGIVQRFTRRRCALGALLPNSYLTLKTFKSATCCGLCNLSSHSRFDSVIHRVKSKTNAPSCSLRPQHGMYAGGLVSEVLDHHGIAALRIRRLSFGVTAVAATLMGASFTLAAFPHTIPIKVAFFIPIQVCTLTDTQPLEFWALRMGCLIEQD